MYPCGRIETSRPDPPLLPCLANRADSADSSRTQKQMR